MKAKIFLYLSVVCFLFFVSAFFTGCKEDKSWFRNAVVQGVVIDTTTNSPVGDATVTLIRVETLSGNCLLGPCGTITKRVMDTQTASDGNFYIKFRDKKKYTYQLKAEKTGYHSSQDIIFGNNSQIINLTTKNDYKIIYIVKR